VRCPSRHLTQTRGFADLFSGAPKAAFPCRSPVVPLHFRGDVLGRSPFETERVPPAGLLQTARYTVRVAAWPPAVNPRRARVGLRPSLAGDSRAASQQWPWNIPAGAGLVGPGAIRHVVAWGLAGGL